jgi:hypothetical protein
VDPATHNENGQFAKANTRCTFLEAQRQCLQPQLNDDAELTITKAKERREKKSNGSIGTTAPCTEMNMLPASLM